MVFEKLGNVLGVSIIIGYSTYMLGKSEYEKMEKVYAYKKKVLEDYTKLNQCNRYAHPYTYDQDGSKNQSNILLIHPSKVPFHKDCKDLYDMYVESYKNYEKHKYPPMPKYFI